jgi:hypothetical protein
MNGNNGFFTYGSVIGTKKGSDTWIGIIMSETKMNGTVKKADNIREVNKQQLKLFLLNIKVKQNDCLGFIL